jgi:endonuclease/exonuclease/phosphatase family metal-dependent hydrolase
MLCSNIRITLRKGFFYWISALALMAVLGFPSPALANRMIQGRITTMSGQPAAGMMVIAWDEDDVLGGNHDRMGDATTDAWGYYSIGPYEGKHWDGAPHFITSWRPDIFIMVYAWIGSRWIPVKKSRTYEDHKMADDLTIDLQLTGIWGIIRDTDGRPIDGAWVKAFDQDDLIPGLDDEHDYLNQARTNASGRFEMLYEGKDWDTRVPGSTSWRPDIFLEVYHSVRGRQIKVNKRSGVAYDQRHDSNLEINESIPLISNIDYTVPSGRPGLHVLAYNIYMRPTSLFRNGQAIRVPLIAQEILRDYYDIVVLCEAFDDDVRAALVTRLSSAYPHRSRILGSDVDVRQDGGVMILSRWPIENANGEQRLFGTSCLGSDCMADKGVMYVRINKNGTRYHIFGTHTQSGGEPSRMEMRKVQFRVIKTFIDDKKIPNSEPVIIAGDLNVDMHAHHDEYVEMLEILNAAHPGLKGHPYSIDQKLNDLGGDNGSQQLLDYVLYSRNHKPPIKLRTVSQVYVPAALNRVMFYRADNGWREYTHEWYMWDISDHYPVYGHFQFYHLQAIRPLQPGS